MDRKTISFAAKTVGNQPATIISLTGNAPGRPVIAHIEGYKEANDFTTEGRLFLGDGHSVFDLVNADGTPFDIRLYQEKPEAKHFQKDTAGKPRVNLLLQWCPNAMLGIAKVFTYGDAKYGNGEGWKDIEDAKSHYLGALLRHQLKLECGEVVDKESGCYHTDMIAANAMFLAELAHIKRKQGELHVPTQEGKPSTKDHCSFNPNGCSGCTGCGTPR